MEWELQRGIVETEGTTMEKGNILCSEIDKGSYQESTVSDSMGLDTLHESKLEAPQL